VWPAADAVKVQAGGAATVSLWIKPEAVDAGTLLAWGPLQLVVQAGRLGARLGAVRAEGGELRAGTWNHVAATLAGGKLRLYANGQEVAQADAATPALVGEWRVGQGLRGAVDEVQLANAARSAAWLKLAAAAEGTEGRLVRATREGRDQPAEGASPGYMGILVKNLTIDAWVVIVILAGMFVLAAWVMVDKLMFIGRADGDNRRFLARFRDSGQGVLALRDAGAHPNSSLYRLYLAGLRELERRKVGEGNAAPLSGASLDAVKASVDADLVRESHRLNSGMVWLTIAISGGPFLGLLGTVVGVMITFAAIAAAGDVNVNAIAPGIAAALLATVAGLAVAIPALFGYNYLASRIKNVSADMQIFVDEFITRVAEEYGA
jgi:biopolymer transport protein ExbB